MKSDIVKSNLRDYYNCEAEFRNLAEKDDWKIDKRNIFYNLVIKENKYTILEIGAGSGHDSKFFMEAGFEVLAIDLSSEMVKRCREKNINAHEMDFYNLAQLNQKFDCIWSMNSLLHVPKSDLQEVLISIDSVLNKNGLFFMGVYGGVDTENTWVNDISETPRLFSYYSESKIKDILGKFFDIISFNQFDVGRNCDFQAITMRKK